MGPVLEPDLHAREALEPARIEADDLALVDDDHGRADLARDQDRPVSGLDVECRELDAPLGG